MSGVEKAQGQGTRRASLSDDEIGLFQQPEADIVSALLYVDFKKFKTRTNS